MTSKAITRGFASLTPKSQMVTLRKVIGWFTEYSLRYDLYRLRKELKILFPEYENLKLDTDEMTENTLYRNEALKLISSKDYQDDILENLETLQITIDIFEAVGEDTIEFIQSPDREKQLKEFLNKLKMIKSFTRNLEFCLFLYIF